jgi:phosphoribosylaminoimidazole carboxylase (NCAIR synthetase)
MEKNKNEYGEIQRVKRFEKNRNEKYFVFVIVLVESFVVVEFEVDVVISPRLRNQHFVRWPLKRSNLR